MNNATRFMLGIAFICLLFGLAWPWVQFASPEQKAQNLADLATLVSRTDSLPQIVQAFLQEYGWKSYHDVSGAQSFFVQDLALGETFTHMHERDRLFSWDFFRLASAGMTRVLIIALAALCFGVGIVSASLIRQHLSRPDSAEIDLYGGEGKVLDSSLSSMTLILAVLSGTAVILLFLFVFQLPLLDTLGHRGDRALSFAGMIVGAHVTKVPRVLIPLGLLALIVAGFEAFLHVAAHHGRSQSADDSFY